MISMSEIVTARISPGSSLVVVLLRLKSTPNITTKYDLKSHRSWGFHSRSIVAI